MAAVLRCVLACALAACVLGHAVLVDPRPLNTNPTTATPCGVNTYPTTPVPAATWKAGEPATVTFQLVAGDGGTQVYAYIDPNGKTNFGTTDLLGGKGAMDQGLRKYDYTFTVPADLVCNPVCMLRMVTNQNNWNSCAYVNVTCPTCPAPPPPPPKCTAATNLNFCADYYDNTNVLVPGDATIKSLEANAKLAYEQYINNTNVFEYGSNVTCQRTFKQFICKQNLVPCPGSNQNISSEANCDQTCENLGAVCGFTTSHEQLYDCKTFPKCLGDSGASFTVLSLSAVAAALLALFL